jgi:hypothetical protein
MIKFFRKIRQRLLNENKLSKYLIYAIGEIILVVIGILIALEINSLNEGKKNRILERTVLSEIESTTNNNINQLKRTIEGMEMMSRSGEIILNVWENKTPYSDSLNIHFQRSAWNGMNWITGYSNAGYENLKNIGFDIITNNSLKGSIISKFETERPKILRSFESTQLMILYKEHFLRNFITVDNGWFPIEYSRLLKDTYYYSIIKELQVRRKMKIEVLSEIILINEKRAREIKKELIKLGILKNKK